MAISDYIPSPVKALSSCAGHWATDRVKKHPWDAVWTTATLGVFATYASVPGIVAITTYHAARYGLEHVLSKKDFGDKGFLRSCLRHALGVCAGFPLGLALQATVCPNDLKNNTNRPSICHRATGHRTSYQPHSKEESVGILLNPPLTAPYPR